MRILPLLLTALTMIPASLPAANPWLTDLNAALGKARAENKIVLINFTGSDWCGWCIRLKREVFATPAFDSFASNNLVLVEVDFPRGKSLPAAQQRANQALAERFGISGYPTLVVLGSDGKELGRLGYEPGGPRNFIASLERIGGPRIRQVAEAKPSGSPAPPPAATTSKPVVLAKRPGSPPASPPPPAAAPPITTSNTPPPSIDGLVLKGVSGPPGKRVAIINDRSLTAGEGAVIQADGRRLKVRVVKVGEKSVFLKVDDAPQPVELKLREGL